MKTTSLSGTISARVAAIRYAIPARELAGFRCPDCGGQVRPTTGRGRKFPCRFRDFALPRDLPVPTCDRCGEGYLGATLAKVIDGVLAPRYARWKRRPRASDSRRRERAAATRGPP